jgi:hypothetical protein
VKQKEIALLLKAVTSAEEANQTTRRATKKTAGEQAHKGS